MSVLWEIFGGAWRNFGGYTEKVEWLTEIMAAMPGHNYYRIRTSISLSEQIGSNSAIEVGNPDDCSSILGQSKHFMLE